MTLPDRLALAITHYGVSRDILGLGFWRSLWLAWKALRSGKA